MPSQRLSAVGNPCLQAVSLINPLATVARYDGSLAEITGDGLRVRETWPRYPDDITTPQVVPYWTLKWTWAGAPGQYRVTIDGQMDSTIGTPRPAGLRSVWALFRVNGKQITAQTKKGDPFLNVDALDPFTWSGFNGWIDASYDEDDLHVYPWVVLNPGDEVEVLFISDIESTGFQFIPFEAERLCFILDSDAPSSSDCTDLWDWGTAPLGDAWGSPNGWGGQKLIPDQIWTHLGITPYDEAEFSYGVNFVDYDMCALADGTVYVFFHDAWSHGLSFGNGNPDRKSPYYHYLVIKKYDPGAGTWSQVATININTPTEAYAIDGVSCEIGPDESIYCSWWEVDTYFTSPNDYELWKWHLIKLDPSDDSYVELGTGQNAVTPDGTNTLANYSGDTLANHIAVSSNGDLFVGGIEEVYDDHGGVGFPQNDHRLFVWRWNGSAWSDLSLPAPSDLGTNDWWQVNGENSFYDRVPTMVCARDGEGPVTDGFTLVYPYTYQGVAPPSYLEYLAGVTISYTVGTGWHDEILTDWAELLYAQQTGGLTSGVDFSPYSLVAFDADILWSASLGKLVFVADHVGTGTGESWVMYQMNNAGTQWEPIETSPPSVAGPWRQARNTSAIGPDGNVYRCMWSDWHATAPYLGIDIPRITKHSPGYGPGWSNAVRREWGQVTDKVFPWQGGQYSTANMRLRIVGDSAYVMMNAFTESAGVDFGEDEWADAIYVFKLDAVACA